MTYRAPEAAYDAAAIVIAAEGCPFPEALARDVLAAAAPRIAQDVVKMATTALSAIEQHDPSCLSLYGDDPEESPCDCSWESIATVVRQLEEKVGTVT